jgi:hypothetical protein
MKTMAEVIGVSRSNLIERMRERAKKRIGRPPLPDDKLVAEIKAVIAELPTYGYRRYALQWLNVTPFAAVQSSTLWQRGSTETSTAAGLPGILGLTSQSQTTTSLPTFLGVQLDTRLALANGTVWSPFLRAAWVHEFSPDRSIANSFVSVPGTLFTVDGARAWSDALKLNAVRGSHSINMRRCSPVSTASLPTAAKATRDVEGSDSAGECARAHYDLV